MSPEDPRHGSGAGYLAETKAGIPHCQPCRDARARYQRWREYDNALGRPRKMPALGARRRVHALQRLGWSLSMIAHEAGWNSPEALQYVMRSESVTRRSWQRISDVYERLSMTLPPYNSATARARLRAERLGYAPPLAWDDIDRDPAPRLGSSGHHNDDIDEAVVERVMAGENLPTTRAEKDEIVRRWRALGWSLNELERRTGWKCDRYGREPLQEAS